MLGQEMPPLATMAKWALDDSDKKSLFTVTHASFFIYVIVYLNFTYIEAET